MTPNPPTLMIASGNAHKVEEIRRIVFDVLGEGAARIVCGADYPDVPEPIEDGDTFAANALKKAREYANATGLLTLADDSGIVVDALDGRPGVISARYAPTIPECIARVLREMEGVPTKRRTARFECVMALVDPQGGFVTRNGTVAGRLTTALRGQSGFGYDPIFELTEPPHAGRTAAELAPDEKDAVSHRGRALRAIAPLIAASLVAGHVVDDDQPKRTPVEEPIADDKAIRCYLEQHVCPALHIPPAIERIAKPALGVKSTLFLVRPSGRALPFVVRCLTSRAEARRLIDIYRFAEGHDLPTPRLLHADASGEHIKDHGFATVVEECLEGDHRTARPRSDDPSVERPVDTPPDAAQLDALARTLAALHRIESDRWGHPCRRGTAWIPWSLRGRLAFDRLILGKFKNRLASVERFDPAYESTWRGRILDFARSFRRGWDGGPPFGLTHDKLNPGNVLFAPDAEAFLLDLGSLQFGFPGKDLAAALYFFCDGAEAEVRFRRIYFELLPDRVRDHFERNEPLYRAYHHLSRWAARAHGLARKRESGYTLSLASAEREREAMWGWIEKTAGSVNSSE